MKKVATQKVSLETLMESISRNLSQICSLENIFSKTMEALQYAWLNYQCACSMFATVLFENCVQLGLKQNNQFHTAFQGVRKKQILRQ